jgi:RNA polymerase sigma factor (sigma-70 family)
MRTDGEGTILHYLRRLTPPADGATADRDLLARFAATADETAFEALVRRHGPLVWGVCLRLLADPHDAEDAFQATFLVLARRAAAVGRRELLANWLHAVARRCALKARAVRARRRCHERQVEVMPEPCAAPQSAWEELRPDLDEELARLADKYRLPVLLCYLQGLTRNEAAATLGWPPGTVAGRLARALDLLRRRLARRGLTLAAGALAAALTGRASAAVPAHLVRAVTTAAPLVASSGVVAAGVSASVVALTQGALKSMTTTKTILTLAALLGVGLLASGATVFGLGLAGRAGSTPTAYERRDPPGETKHAPPAPDKPHGTPPLRPAEEKPKEKPPAKDKPRRLKPDEAAALIRDYLVDDKPGRKLPETLRVKDLTTDEVWDRLDAQLFRLERESGPMPDFFTIRNKEVAALHEGLSGFHLRSFCVADLRGGRKPLLVFSYSWGSGAWRANVAALDLSAKEPKPVVAPQALFDDPTYYWDVKTADGKAVRVEGKGVNFGELVFTEKDGKASLRLKLSDDLPARIRKKIRELPLN